MVSRNFWLLLGLVLVSLLCVLRLESSIKSHYVLSFGVLLLLAVLLFVSVFALLFDQDWAWPLSTIGFCGVVLLSLLFYLVNKADSLFFLLSVVLGITGIVSGVSYAGIVEDVFESLPRMEFVKPVSKKPRKR